MRRWYRSICPGFWMRKTRACSCPNCGRCSIVRSRTQSAFHSCWSTWRGRRSGSTLPARFSTQHSSFLCLLQLLLSAASLSTSFLLPFSHPLHAHSFYSSSVVHYSCDHIFHLLLVPFIWAEFCDLGSAKVWESPIVLGRSQVAEYSHEIQSEFPQVLSKLLKINFQQKINVKTVNFFTSN